MENGKLNVNFSKNKSKNTFGNAYISNQNDDDDNQFVNLKSQQLDKPLQITKIKNSQTIQNNSSLNSNNKQSQNVKGKQNDQIKNQKLPNQIIQTQNNSFKNKKIIQGNNNQQTKRKEELKNSKLKQSSFNNHQVKTKIDKKVSSQQSSSSNSDQQESKESVKPKKQQQKIAQIKNSFNQINQSIEDLKDNYARLDANQIMLIINKKQKEKEIRQFLMKKRLQKKQRHRKLKKMRQKEQLQIARREQVQKNEKQKNRQAKLHQAKIISYVQPKKRKQKYREEQKVKRNQVQKYYKKYQNSQLLYQKKQKQYQEKVKKAKIQQQQILEVRRIRFRSLDEDQLEDHKRRYQEKLQELENAKRQARQQQVNKINQDNIIIKDQLWKGHSHDIVDEQLQQIKKKKKQPQQKMKKVKKYQEYIRNNFLPKTVQPKNSNIHSSKIMQTLGNYSGKYHIPPESILQHYDPNKKHVIKYRYFKGKSVGQVIQSIPLPKSYSQQKKIGESYLEYIKSLPKKKVAEQNTQIDTLDLQMLNKKFNSIVKVKRRSLPFYESPLRQNKISLSSCPTRQQVKMVVEKLHSQDDRIKCKQKLIKTKKNTSNTYDQQKQVHKDLVRNMQRKLQLLAQL